MESELNLNPTWCSNPWPHPHFLVVLLCHQFVCSQWSWQWNLGIFSKVLESVEVGQPRKRRCHCRLNDSIIPCAMTTPRLQIEPQHFQFCCHHWKKRMLQKGFTKWEIEKEILLYQDFIGKWDIPALITFVVLFRNQIQNCSINAVKKGMQDLVTPDKKSKQLVVKCKIDFFREKKSSQNVQRNMTY